MKLTWADIVIIISLIGSGVCLWAEYISELIGADNWTILYFGVGLVLLAGAILVYKIIKKFKS